MITKGTAQPPEQQQPALIEFIEFHEAPLQDGEYTIKLTQTVTAPGIDQQNVFSTERYLYVAGNRFSFQPDDVYAIFPPAGSLGEYSNVLPHLVLTRSTVPWERLAVALTQAEEDALNKLAQTRSSVEQTLADSAAQKKKTPWLVLLHLTEDEIVQQKTTTLADLRTDIAIWPTIGNLEIGQHDDDKVEIIDVPSAIVKSLMPTYDELRYQAHVRQGKDIHDQALGDEKAILICNRLPKQGTNSVVHLVAVEHRYSESGFDSSNQTTGGNIRLISLKSWRFASLSEKKGFNGLLLHLNHPLLFDLPYAAADAHQLDQGQIPQSLRQYFAQQGAPLTAQAEVVISPARAGQLWRIRDGEEAYLVSRTQDQLTVHRQDTDSSHTLRLPDVREEDANHFLRMGAVPCPHLFRQGDHSYSWYHGPLAPSNQALATVPDKLFPVKAADALLRYYPQAGMFDVSYAAAWELGRLMALKSRHFAFNLYQWKRYHVQQVKQIEQHHLYAHLPAADAVAEKSDLPTMVDQWLSMTSLLHNVPFNYLVPDERMLPVESIRYFTFDPLWIASLLDGAFSIGRVSPAAHASDGHHSAKVAAMAQPQVSGILLRSAVVAGWPGLLVDGYDYTFDASNKDKDEEEIPDSYRLPCLRLEKLSSNVLIALFAGDAKVIDVHQKPQTIHFGVDKRIDEQGNETFSKRLRNGEGDEAPTERLTTLPWRDNHPGVVDMTKLFASIKGKAANLQLGNEFTSAQFAMEMIEGVQKVRFVRAK